MNTTSQSQGPSQDKPQESRLECNICYDDSTEPVTTTCGHIYCWSCIYKWLRSAPEHNYCPVCNNVISEEKIIPLYTKNNTHHQRKTEENIPKRPQPQREERKENDQNRRNNNWFHGFGTNAFFNTLFTGINFNTPNMRISLGVPALIPMLIIFAFNFLSGFLFSGSDFFEYDNYSNQNQGRSQSRQGTNGRTQRSTQGHSANTNNYNGIVEDDNTYIKFLVILVLFMALPFLIRRIMRN